MGQWQSTDRRKAVGGVSEYRIQYFMIKPQDSAKKLHSQEQSVF